MSSPLTDTSAPVGVTLPEHTIFPPTSISRAAQAALSAGAALTLPQRPPIDQLDAWRSIQAASKVAAEVGARRTLSTARCTVETMEMGGVTVHIGRPDVVRPGAEPLVYLYVHGGAFLFGEQWLAMASAAKYADRLGVTVVSVDHRVPPDHPFPVPGQDCLAVYRALLGKCDTRHIAVGGSSAGGNLALVAMMMARDEGLTLPAALLLMSPEVDLTESGDSFRTNELLDTFLKHSLADCNAIYAAGADLRSPRLSPLFADLSRLPPTFIQSGTRDLFLSSAVMLHRKMLDSGVNADLNIWEAMPHGGFSLSPGVPEDDQVDIAVKAFIEKHLG